MLRHCEMMHLEDFFESIEDLPVVFRDMLVTVRELDLVVQNAIDKKTKESEEFLQRAGRMKPDRRESVFQSLMTDFRKILDDANEKINVVEKLDNILVNSLRQLDRQIAQFKSHLDIIDSRISASIEKKVAEGEVPVIDISSKSETQKRKRPSKSKKKGSTISSTLANAGFVQITKPTKMLNSAEDKENIGSSAAVRLNVGFTVLPGTEITYDHTLYCICNQVSYGDMIACDNASCPIEWFHYACVNLKTAPEGTWYCPKCNVCEVSSSLN